MTHTHAVKAHSNDYFYREGMELRDPPPGVVVDDLWMDVRTSQFSRWIPLSSSPSDGGIVALAADHMWQGDELMDALVATWQSDPSAGRRDFERALTAGIDSVMNPSAELQALFVQIDNPPTWFDSERYERGRQISCDESLAGSMGALAHDLLMTIVSHHVSTATHATRSFVEDTSSRILETATWFGEATRPGAWQRHSPAFYHIARLRLLHSLARSVAMKGQPGANFATFGNPIPAAVVAGGGISFGITSVLLDHWYGRPAKRDDLDAVVAYWGYLGYLLGVPEDLVPRNLDDGLRLTNYIYATSGGPTAGTTYLGEMLVNRASGGPVQHAITNVAVAVLRHIFLSFLEFYSGKKLLEALYQARPDFRGHRPLTVAAIGVGVRINVHWRAFSDRLPMREARRARRVAKGSPARLGGVRTMRWVYKLLHLDTAITYRKHDQSASATTGLPPTSCPAGHRTNPPNVGR